MSMKLTPSSTARRSVGLRLLAARRLAPDARPVIRMAPKPIRLTVRSPPMPIVPAAAALGSPLIEPPVRLVGPGRQPGRSAHYAPLLFARAAPRIAQRAHRQGSK